MVDILIFLASLLIVLKSADYFVDSSQALAVYSRLPPVLIGATIVAFGTSAPELFVAGYAAYLHQPDVVYGNIFGSNMANTGLIFGLAMALAPIQLNALFRSQVGATVVAMVAYTGLLLVMVPSRMVAAGCVILFVGYQVRQIKQADRFESGEPSYRLVWAILIFLGSLLGLIISSRLMVIQVVTMAAIWGVSTEFLSLFLVAFGTSVPELITTVKFIQKKQSDIVVGNVFGSNLFNLVLVLPVAWLVHPIPFLSRYFLEMGIVFIVSLGFLGMSYWRPVSFRWMGWGGIVLYITYILVAFLTS